MSTSKVLALYYFESCPFCQMVISTISSLDLLVDFRDISTNQEYLNKLVGDTGKQTVPCLYIDDEPMFESADIIHWLKTNSNSLSKA